MEHLKTFESFTAEINENVFTDMVSKAKKSISGWVNKKLAEATTKQMDIISKNPKLQQLVNTLREQMAAAPKEAAILKGLTQDPSKLTAAIEQQGGNLNEALMLEGVNIKDVIIKALKVLGIGAAILATIGAIVAGAMIGGAGFLLSGVGVLGAAILLASLPKPIEIPGIMNSTTK